MNQKNTTRLKSNLTRGSPNLNENKPKSDKNEVIFALVGNSSTVREKNLSSSNMQANYRESSSNQLKSSLYSFNSYQRRFFNAKEPSVVNLPFQYKSEDDDATIEIDCSKSDVKIRLYKKHPSSFKNNKLTFENKNDNQKCKIG